MNMLSSGLLGHQTTMRGLGHACKQNIHAHKIKTNKSSKERGGKKKREEILL